MNSQDILRNLGISLDVELDNSETYDYEIAGFDGDYDPKVIDFTNPIGYDIAIQNNLTNDSILKICVELCEIDNTPNDPNYVYSGITETIRFEDFTEHFNIEDSEGNILHAYKNFILNNDVFTYTGYTGETHYFKVCGYKDCITPSPTPTSTELPTSTPNPTATEQPTPTPTFSSTPEPTPNPTATCTTTVQYLNVQLTDSAKFKLSLWVDDQYTQPDSAECDYVVSGQARGDMGTVYEGVETITHGDHNHQFNLAPVLNDGEVVTGFTVYSIDTTQCTCPTIVDFDPFKPTPTPEPTQTLTPTPTSTQIPRLSGVVSSFNPNSNNPITLNELIRPFVEQSYGTIYSFICDNDINQIVFDLTKTTTGNASQIPNIGDVITNINDNTPYSNDNLLHFKQTTFGTFNTMTDYRWITTDENGAITDITQLPLCPTPNPTVTPNPTATENPTATPVPTSTEQPTPMPTVTEQPTPTPNPTSTPEPTPNPTATEVLNDIPLSFNYSLGMGSLSWSGLTISELSEATCNALVGNYIISQYYGTLGVGTQFYNPNNIASNQSWVTNQYFGTNNAPNGIWVQGSTEYIIETDFNGVVTRYESFNVTCPSPTSTPTPEPTSTPQPTPIPTVTENPTATPNPTATEQPTPMPTATEPPTATPQPTSTPEPTPNSNVQLNFYNDLNGLTVSRIYVNTNVYDTGDFPMSSNENTTLTGLSHTNGLVGLQIVYDFQSQNSPKNIYVYVDGELDVTTYTSTDITFTIGNTIPVQDNSIITVRQYSTPLPTSSPTPEPTSTPIPTSTPEPTEVLVQDINLIFQINNDGGVNPWLSGSSTYSDVQNHLCTYGANNWNANTRQTTGDPNNPQTGDRFYAGGFPIETPQNVLHFYPNNLSISNWSWIEIDSNGYITVSGFTCSTPTPTSTDVPEPTPTPTVDVSSFKLHVYNQTTNFTIVDFKLSQSNNAMSNRLSFDSSGKHRVDPNSEAHHSVATLDTNYNYFRINIPATGSGVYYGWYYLNGSFAGLGWQYAFSNIVDLRNGPGGQANYYTLGPNDVVEIYLTDTDTPPVAAPTSTPTSTPNPTPTVTVSLWEPTPDAWFDASDTSSYTTSGSNLITVNDKSGNFNMSVDGTPTRVSNALNNLNVWDFSGSESLISSNSGPYASNGNHWAIGVFQYHTTDSTKDSFWSADGNRTYAISSGNSNSTWYGEIDYDGNNSIVNGKPINTFTQIINQSTWVIVAVIANKTDNEFYGRINGNIRTNIDVYSNSMDTNCTDLRMMRNRSGVKLDGRMAEYFHFASYVGGDTNNYSEVWKAEGYLAHKWGLTSLLPSSHPYKNSPPTV